MKPQNDVKKILRDYVEYLFEEQPDGFLIEHKGMTQTVTEWCEYFGGVPDGISNINFLREKIDAKLKRSFLGSPS